MENHNFENEGQFQRKMTSRHLFMLSLGGVIGTGWFLSSGLYYRSSWTAGSCFILSSGSSGCLVIHSNGTNQFS